MKMEQKKGPFSKGSKFRFGGVDARNYTHLGIQMHHRKPIIIEKQFSMSPDVRVKTSEGESDYSINTKGTLEFDGNMGNSITITFLKDMPMETVIDAIYRPEGE